MMRAAAILIVCAALAPRAAIAQELGRLFFTPEQRAALDARRSAKLPDKPAAVAISPTTRVNGSVKRSSGKSTLWLDGYAVTDGNQPEGLRVRRTGDPGRVSVSVGEDGRRVEVRVGDMLDRATGEVKSVLGDGSVRINHGGNATR